MNSKSAAPIGAYRTPAAPSEAEVTAIRQYLDYVKITHAVAVNTFRRGSRDPAGITSIDPSEFSEQVGVLQQRSAKEQQAWRRLVRTFSKHPCPPSCRDVSAKYSAFLVALGEIIDKQVWSTEPGASDPPGTIERMREFNRSLPRFQRQCIAAAKDVNASMEEVCTRMGIRQTFKISDK